MLLSLKRLLGVILFDLPGFFRSLYIKNGCYLSLCNRNERLEESPDGNGYVCSWQWTSDLHAPKVIPALGKRLYRKAFRDHPVIFASEPSVIKAVPEVTFVIGHRGLDRFPHLEATLASIAGQVGASIECIVVEQDVTPQIQNRLPAWVRYVHSPTPDTEAPYNRAMAFNVGVQAASAELLILHDNDMPVPCDYAVANLSRMTKGFEVINLKRFVFYLDPSTSRKVSARKAISWRPGIDHILQNLEGGGSIAITRAAYFAIGGMDESFVGWGGEDNEFWERALTRKVYPYGSMPLIHLWHRAQPEKNSAQQNGVSRYAELTRISPESRINSLKSKFDLSKGSDA